MSNTKEFKLRVISPSFDSELTDVLIELNHLKKLKLQGTTVPWVFSQLKNIFHILESVGSARIEGNGSVMHSKHQKTSAPHKGKRVPFFIKNL